MKLNFVFAFLSINIKNIILEYQDNRCLSCNNKFNNKTIPYEFHRINHNSSDNRRNNIIALCSNCHNAHHRYNMSVPIFKSPYLPHK